MSVTDAAATASSVTTLSVPHGAGAPTVHVPDGAPIAASQGFEFGGRTVSVFVAGNMVGGQTTSTLYVYESVPGVAGRASSTATTGWTVRTVVPTLSQNIVSISSVVYSGSSSESLLSMFTGKVLVTKDYLCIFFRRVGPNVRPGLSDG